MAEINRETLELAALAAGMIPAEFAGNVNYLDGVLDRWSPHLDDGDAMRLAVQLKMTTDCSEDWCWAVTRHTETAEVAHDGTEPDKLRAWREAVVLCAAAVGERMRKGVA